VEIIEYLTILTLAVMVFGSFLIWLSRQNKGKRAYKAGDEGVSAMYGVYNQQVDDVLKLKDNQIKRLTAKINTLESEYEEEEEEEPTKKLEGLKPILASRGINPALLDNPFVQKLIKKYTKDMGIEEIVTLAQQFGLFKGSNKPQSLDSGAASPTGTSQYF